MAKNYEDLGLNELLQNKNSLAVRDTNYKTGMEIDSEIESMGASQLTSGIFTGTIHVGADKAITLDGPNNRITVGTAGNIVIDGATEKITVGANSRIEIDSLNERILMSDSSNERILLDAGNGDFKLSQAGNDVTTASDNKLIWSSDFNMFKIIASGVASVSLSSGADSQTTTTAHNQSFKPAFLAYADFGSGNKGQCPLMFFEFVSGFIRINKLVQVFVNATHIKFTAAHDQNEGAETFNFRYYLLRETAT